MDAAEQRKRAELLGQAYVKGLNLYNAPIDDAADFAAWKLSVEHWRMETDDLIRGQMEEWDVADFSNTTNIMAADIARPHKVGAEHNDRLVVLERRLENLKKLREKVKRG